MSPYMLNSASQKPQCQALKLLRLISNDKGMLTGLQTGTQKPILGQ
jgi:hypothetical protein